MRTITVSSRAITLRVDRLLTPAMTSMVWEIASAIDAARVPANPQNAIWLTIPTAQLRGGEGSRTDNVWLRQCLDRLTGVKISGEHGGDPWGAVVLAEWHIEGGGSVARLLIPPIALPVFRSPATFAKIEETAAHRLTGHGRQLYAILADKKRLKRQRWWTFELDELRTLMGVADKRAYDVWGQFRKRVINPAIEAINDYGTVNVRMTPVKTGRSITAVRFDWAWKDPHEAKATAEANDRHSAARKREQAADDAPPLIRDEDQAEPALTWWGRQSQNERDAWADRVGRTFEAGGMIVPRRDADLARAAYAEANKQA